MADWRAAEPGCSRFLGALGGDLCGRDQGGRDGGSLVALGTGAITFLGVWRLRGPRVSDT
jgi:hypothetical protein